MSKTKTLHFTPAMTLHGKEETNDEMDYQESLAQLGAVLPSHLDYAGIEAACHCADMHPETVYHRLLAGGRDIPESFWEALFGPDWKAYLMGRR